MALQTSQILIVALLALMSQGILARSSYIPMSPSREMALMEDIGNSDEAYTEPRKYSKQEINNFLINWPWLRELISMEYDDSSSKSLIPEEPYLERYDVLPTLTPLKQRIPLRKNISKDRIKKKDNYLTTDYMSACHFKICNMGRKRNVVLI